jgi:glycosyltransferase involved in cell wall biosynthesis
MTDRKCRILLVATHPTQYASSVFRLLASNPRLEIQVIYCSLQGAKPGFDREFGREVHWDIPLLDGYPWVELPNRANQPGLGRFWGLVNTGLWTLIRREQFDAVVFYTGYRYATFWIGLLAAKISGIGVIFGTDAWTLFPLDGRRWKRHVKRLMWPLLFRLADVTIVPSSGGVNLLRSLGIPEHRVVLTPYVVDNRRWQQAVARVDRAAVRAGWQIPTDAPVILFSAKLQPWKRPLDLLHAFARAAIPGSYLLFAGEGPLRGELVKEIERLGLQERVKLLGFVNQSTLPALYRAADVLVLPSHYDAFGVVVNEAMLCGSIPIVSDKVGARFDLIEEGKTGFIFPVGDVDKLAALLVGALSDPVKLRRMSEVAMEKIAAWSPELNAERLLEAVDAARTKATRPHVTPGVAARSRSAPSNRP